MRWLLAVVLGLLLPRAASVLNVRKTAAVVAQDSASRGTVRACAGAEKVYADGFYRVACETDISPKETRYVFADLVCKGLPSCRKKQAKMTPEICFEFCREYPVNFFGIQGDECYCTPYYHPKSTHGGKCDFHCAGDGKEICGSADKASIFEQHLCGDSASEAEAAFKTAGEAKDKVADAVADAKSLSDGLVAMSEHWDLGVCSVSKQSVCDLKGKWLEDSGKLDKLSAKAAQEVKECEKDEASLKNLTEAIAAGNATGSDYSSMEAVTKALTRTHAVELSVAGAAIETQVGSLGGAMVKAEALENFASLYTPLENASMAGTHSICDLKVLQSLSAVAENEPAVCGTVCLTLAGCVGFNYQYKDGVMACQLLSKETLVKPGFLFAVPVFEITNTKVADLTFGNIGCYAKQAFMNDNGRGKTKVSVVKKVIKE